MRSRGPSPLASACSPAESERAYAPDAPLERLATGFVFTEGPLWDERRGGLLFSELEQPFSGCGGRLLLWQPPGTVTVLRRPSCNANGLAFDLDGALLCAEHGSRSITRCDLAAGTVHTVAAGFEGAPLNPPNDLVVQSDGTLFFSAPDFVAPAPEGAQNGVFRVPAGGGEPRLAARVAAPNGLALSPDEETLYVSDMHLGRVLAFELWPTGELGEPHVLAAPAPLADGLAVDKHGNLFVATTAEGRGAIRVFASDGRALGSIGVPEPATNCAFGASDRRTLFVTAGGSLYAVRLSVPGLALAGASEPRAPR